MTLKSDFKGKIEKITNGWGFFLIKNTVPLNFNFWNNFLIYLRLKWIEFGFQNFGLKLALVTVRLRVDFWTVSHHFLAKMDCWCWTLLCFYCFFSSTETSFSSCFLLFPRYFIWTLNGIDVCIRLVCEDVVSSWIEERDFSLLAILVVLF